MDEGESGYTLPWGMMVNMAGRCYLCGTYPIYRQARGTASMLVRRERDGYRVRLTGETYSRRSAVPWGGQRGRPDSRARVHRRLPATLAVLRHSLTSFTFL